MHVKHEDVFRLICEAGEEGVTRKELAVMLGVERIDAGLHMALTALARERKVTHDHTAPINGPLRYRAVQ